MNIYCCECRRDVEALLTDGAEIYPHRPDLADLPFWKCPICANYVGCHKSKTKKTPLGNIPNPALRQVRRMIHSVLDPMWRNGQMERRDIYHRLSTDLGYPYHTANIRSVQEAQRVLVLLQSYQTERKEKTDENDNLCNPPR